MRIFHFLISFYGPEDLVTAFFSFAPFTRGAAIIVEIRTETVKCEIITDAFVNALNQGWIGLFLDFYFETPRRRDLDGGLKITQDAILEALAINDNRVVDIHLVKRIAPTNPRVEVELEAIPTWQFDDEYLYLEQPEDDN